MLIVCASGARKQKSGGEEGSSKEKPDNFVWTDDEVQLLLKVTGEYKANKEMENIDWNEMFLKPTQSHAQSFVFSKRNLNILLLLLHRFQKVPFSSVYTRPESPKTISFSNFSTLESVFRFFLCHRKRYHRIHRFLVNRRPKRKHIFADSLTPVSCKRGLISSSCGVVNFIYHFRC